MNVSEGADESVVGALADAVADDLLDVHSDSHHNRSVFTLVGEDAPRRLTQAAVELIDVSTHRGVHPRVGAIDVVPFVPLGESTMSEALSARNRYAQWIAKEFDVPVFLYGPERSLPAVRKGAFQTVVPDVGPRVPHETAGAVCVGARDVLVAYNVVVRDVTIDDARAIARDMRSDSVRALALDLDGTIQVSMNLVAPHITGPAEAVDSIASRARVFDTELVGLLPASVLARTPSSRWEELDLAPEKTIEFRIAKWAAQKNQNN